MMAVPWLEVGLGFWTLCVTFGLFPVDRRVQLPCVCNGTSVSSSHFEIPISSIWEFVVMFIFKSSHIPDMRCAMQLDHTVN